jgi:hypothetical protein
LLSGSAGETHISVSRAIKDNAQETMYPGKQKINCRNVKAQKSALLEGNIQQTEMNMRLVAVSAETLRKIKKISEIMNMKIRKKIRYIMMHFKMI